jgi:hypothetical protein
MEFHMSVAEPHHFYASPWQKIEEAPAAPASVLPNGCKYEMENLKTFSHYAFFQFLPVHAEPRVNVAKQNFKRIDNNRLIY